MSREEKGFYYDNKIISYNLLIVSFLITTVKRTWPEKEQWIYGVVFLLLWYGHRLPLAALSCPGCGSHKTWTKSQSPVLLVQQNWRWNVTAAQQIQLLRFQSWFHLLTCQHDPKTPLASGDQTGLKRPASIGWNNVFHVQYEELCLCWNFGVKHDT